MEKWDGIYIKNEVAITKGDRFLGWSKLQVAREYAMEINVEK